MPLNNLCKIVTRESLAKKTAARGLLRVQERYKPAVMQWMREFIEENTKALYGGVTECNLWKN